MATSDITTRFLGCLDRLIDAGMVRSRRQFALELGYHAQGVSEMAAGRRDVPLELIEKAVRVYRLNPHFLFTGLGEPLLGRPEDDGLRLRHLAVVTDQQGEERIVHVPYPAQAGYGRLLDDPVFISDLPTFQLPDPQFKSGTYRSFEIAGSSMEPTLFQGDLVISAFVEPRYWEQAVRNDQMYVVVSAQDVVVKRLVNRLKADKHIECRSDNPAYEPYMIEASDIREIWKIRLKVTARLNAAPAVPVDQDIRMKLELQGRMLETLHHQLTRANAS
jgi:hypothetical protein